jgi:predicted XRE-type DNA-binding protein
VNKLCENINLGNDFIKKKFDDLDGKIESMVEFCQALQRENLELKSRVTDLEAQLEKKGLVEAEFLNQEALIQSRVSKLMEKLDSFSKGAITEGTSNS